MLERIGLTRLINQYLAKRLQLTTTYKGASASARTKPATLLTVIVVKVPEYIASGEKIKISVQERKFLSRAEIN